mmetsp:Transcript_16941/g.36708  ORF Transcript_16941/g.36708 Transcript_16941/m.36708 type:complete len:253 (+) Transcript_16941:98-856(+)
MTVRRLTRLLHFGHLVCASALPCGENRAFIDLGANDGQSLQWFDRVIRPGAQPYTSVTAFELNGAFAPVLGALLRRMPSGSLVQAAAWVRDGEMEASLQLPGSRTAVKAGVLYNMTASSLQVDGVPLNRSPFGGRQRGLRRGERTHSDDAVVRVRTIDLASWLAVHFCSADDVFVKMDIEGAEFEVLEHLLDQGVAGLIDSIYIEWHTTKRGAGRGQMLLGRQKRISGGLKKAGVRLQNWHDGRAGSLVSGV